MGLENRKDALRREIERKARYLESLEAMPDLEVLADGTIVAMTVTYGRSRPYPVVAYKGGDKWFLTGAQSPNGVSSDDLAEWLMSGGRHLRSANILAEFRIEPVHPAEAAFDLAAMLAEGMRANREAGVYLGGLFNQRPSGYGE